MRSSPGHFWARMWQFEWLNGTSPAYNILRRGLTGATFTSMNAPTPINPHSQDNVQFHRTELSVILSLYGRFVAAGEWRDYGISALREVAIFSVFRRTAEQPMYRIEKRPKMAAKQGMYCVVGMDGRILRRGADLKTVLRVLERKLIRSVD